VEYLAQKKGWTVGETLTYLNKKSGVAGISGVSSDFRDLTAASREGNKRATLAMEMFTYACKKYVGAYAAAMNGVDCIVFTAGVGENMAHIRTAICSNMDYIGLSLNETENAKKNSGGILDITGEGSKVKVLVIPTNEELVIARETVELL
jgi:acetate kinase